VEGKRQCLLTALALALHRGVELAEEADLAFLAETDDVAGGKFLGRPHEGAPTGPVEPLGQRRLDLRFGVAADAPAGQPRRNHAGVVDHQRIAGIEQIRQIANAPILQRATRPHHQEPRRVSRHGRPQRYALGRQLEVEQIGAHGFAYMTSTHRRA